MLGGTGDLTGRLLLPGLAELAESGGLADDVVLLAVDRKDWTEDQYRDWARDRLGTFAGHVAEDARSGLVGRLGFQRGDVTDPGDLGTALERAGGVPVIYLALPNVVFLPTLEALEKAGIPDGSTIVVEKPFG